MLPLPCWSLSWFQPLCFHLVSLWLPGMWTLLHLLCLVLRVWLGLLFDSCFALFLFCLCWHEVQLSLHFWPVSLFYFVCLCGCVQAEICHLQSLGLLVILWMSIWSRFLTPMSVLFIIQSIARQNRKGDNIHPCFTPVLMSNSSVKFWPHITFDLNPSYNIFIMVTILQGIP